MGFLAPVASIIPGGQVVAPLLAGVSMLASVAGSISSANAAQQQAKAEQNAANYQAQVAQNQATLYNQQASQQMAVGEQQSYQSQLQSRARAGAIRAAFGASGVDTTTGSAADVLQSQQRLGTLNSLTIQSNAARQAWGSEEAGTSELAQAGLYQQTAQQAPIAGQYASEAALLSGASGLAKQYSSWNLAAGGIGSGAGTATPAAGSNQGYAAVLAAQGSGGGTPATGGWVAPGNQVIF